MFLQSEKIPLNINLNCGHCNKPVNMNKLSDLFKHGNNTGTPHFSVLYKCPNCENISLVTFYYNGYNYFFSSQLPKYTPKHNYDIPKDIETDRFEAWKCFIDESYKASAIMARAALQNAVRRLSAKGNNLKSEIDNLQSKGIITKQLSEFAHEVRITGNDMAHPESITVVNKNEIRESLDFLDGFLETVFVLPAIAERRKKDREGT